MAAQKPKLPTPYNQDIPNGMKDGMAVRVKGRVNDDAIRFNINFDLINDKHHIAFHFDPRHFEGATVMNNLLDYKWGTPQKVGDWFPFKQGQIFFVTFYLYQGVFRVFVNGRFYATFACTPSPEEIKYIRIEHDVEIYEVDVFEPKPSDSMTLCSGMKKDDILLVRGFFKKEGYRFHVDVKKDNNIVMHVNPRRGGGEHVVLNCIHNGAWKYGNGQFVEQPQSMKDHEPFIMHIQAVDTKKFKVFINNQFLTDFTTFDEIGDITDVNVVGDLFLYDFKLIHSMPDNYEESIPAALQVGSLFSFFVIPDETCERFHFNLQKDGNNIPFHYNPRFSLQQGIANTKHNGAWDFDLEERNQICWPYTGKQVFQIDVLVKDYCYRVFVNNEHHLDFNHKSWHPIDTVKQFAMDGDCEFYMPQMI